jgi:hypothetical protein
VKDATPDATRKLEQALGLALGGLTMVVEAVAHADATDDLVLHLWRTWAVQLAAHLRDEFAMTKDDVARSMDLVLGMLPQRVSPGRLRTFKLRIERLLPGIFLGPDTQGV